MGPLVPDIITNELNLVVALLIGLGFGYILEQAGFSSSKKLTGLFYGTDFTVLRVFFTAGATAMAGILLLIKLGWLDGDVIFINPTFLQSALVGGAIMGVGFVVGGYCPGTSLCGLSVGRIDAAAFAVGSFLGVVAFGEAFPALKGLYQAGARGDLTVPAALGVSPSTVLVATIAIALLAFAATGRIERAVTSAAAPEPGLIMRHRLGAAALLVVGIVIALVPTNKERLLAKAADPASHRNAPIELLSADEIAFRLLDADPTLRVVDLRDPVVFRTTGLPGALNLREADLFGQDARLALGRSDRQTVFIGDTEASGIKAAVLARELGFERIVALRGGYAAFQSTIMTPTMPVGAMTGPDKETWAFRAEAGPKLAALIKARSETKPVEKKVRKIAGGCGV